MNLATTKLEGTMRNKKTNKRNVVRTHYLLFYKLFFTELLLLGPERPSQNGSSSVNNSETRITLPPVPNGLDISLFSSQPSNEVRHIREKSYLLIKVIRLQKSV